MSGTRLSKPKKANYTDKYGIKKHLSPYHKMLMNFSKQKTKKRGVQ